MMTRGKDRMSWKLGVTTMIAKDDGDDKSWSVACCCYLLVATPGAANSTHLTQATHSYLSSWQQWASRWWFPIYISINPLVKRRSRLSVPSWRVLPNMVLICLATLPPTYPTFSYLCVAYFSVCANICFPNFFSTSSLYFITHWKGVILFCGLSHFRKQTFVLCFWNSYLLVSALFLALKSYFFFYFFLSCQDEIQTVCPKPTYASKSGSNPCPSFTPMMMMMMMFLVMIEDEDDPSWMIMT